MGGQEWKYENQVLAAAPSKIDEWFIFEIGFEDKTCLRIGYDVKKQKNQGRVIGVLPEYVVSGSTIS